MTQTNNQDILETTISTRHVFDGLILHIDHITNRLPNGKLADREVARHVGASAVVPVDEAGNVYLVWQFRAPIDQVLLELISLYLARDLQSGQSHPDDDEFLNLVKVPLSELVAMIARGEVTDAKTICAVLLADRAMND